MKKRKYLVSVLILILILSIITITILNFSEARKTITVSLEVKDTESKIDNQTTSIEAVNENDAGYYIILPDEINGRYITKYYVEETTIITTEVTTSTQSSTGASSSTDTSESTAAEKTQSTEGASATDGETTVTEASENANASTSENTATEAETSLQETTSEATSGTTQETTSGTSSETTQETTKTETETSYSSKTVEKLPGEKVYLTEDEQTNKKVVLNIKYDYATVDNETMYKKKIQVENEKNEITVTGYLPEDVELQAEEIESEEIFDSVQENYENVIEINVAYDIKIISNEQEFEPEDIGQDVEVNISGLELEGDNRVVHITEENEIQEVESEVDEECENITFKAESFSYYAVLTVTNVNAEVAVGISLWTGEIASSFSLGAGTESDPYLITSAGELAYLAQQVNGGKAYSGTYFKMMSNIDLNYNAWTPIGTATESFSGVFDGNGFTISNATIEVASTDISMQAYGIFGSISGSSTSSAIIKNVDFENITISILTNATISSNNFAYKIGIVTGAMYTYTEIQNVIVQNSQITHSGTITAGTSKIGNRTTYYYPAIYAGGIAGNACLSSSDDTTKVTAGNYVIDNCYSDVDITINTALTQVYQSSKFNIGGIIGRISNENNIWPTDCLYTGTITSAYSTIGPIFGAEINSGNDTNTATAYYSSLANVSSNIWVGNTSATITSYYTSYTVNGTTFTDSLSSGNNVSRRSNTNSNIGYVQGVNKGLYTTSISDTMLTMFNTNASNDGNSTWIYEDGEFSFKHSLTVEVIETIEDSAKTYKMVPTSSLTNPTYTFTWYKDGEEVSATTSTTDGDTYSEYTVEPSIYSDIVIQVFVSDGEETVIVNFTVARLTVYIEITYDENTNSLIAEIKGTALPYLTLSNYTYQWYTEDISGMETEELEGETSLTLEDISSELDYKIIATYTVNGEVNELFTVSATYEPADRIVIYVDYSDGNNSNDGYTPETAVKTLPTAYGKLNSDTEKNTTRKNVIVIIGDYTVMDVFTTQSNSTYEKNVTITGCYKGTNYDATLLMSYTGSNYNFINGDTVFEYLIFKGATDGTGQAYIFSQGHNITMGEQIYMENYASASVNQGLILGSNQSAPSFTLFGGYYRYNESSLPRNNSVITIKSGAYGRIVLGGSPGTTPGNIANTYSQSSNFIGNPNTNEYYNCTVNIDIENSTKESYTYDVNLLVGGSAWGNMYADITENIYSGTIGRILGGNIGDAQTSEIDEFPFDTFIGSTTINITGGTIDEVYGGCLGRNMGGTQSTNDCEAYFYGTIEINISGGTIKEYLYGAGAGRCYRI